MSPIKTWLTIVAGLVGVVSGILLKGSFIHWAIVMSVGFFLGLPFALFVTLWFCFGLKRLGAVPPGLPMTLGLGLVVGGALLVSLGTGAAIHHSHVREARRYVARVVPLLEGYHQLNGRYPATMDEAKLPPPPKLLSAPGSYAADGAGSGHFRFEYWDDSQLVGGYAFDSTTGEWSHLH